jgi:putative AdoMet-dependent methyltransferase
MPFNKRACYFLIQKEIIMPISDKEHSLLDKQHHAIVASRYDELVNLPRQQLNNCLFRKVNKFLPKGRKKMLDLGAGTGQMSARFGKNFQGVLLVDHSKEMLNQAKKNLPIVDGERYRLKETDALEFLSKTEEFFDFVACSGFLHHLDETELVNTVKNIYRILEKNGCAVIAEPIKTEQTEPTFIRHWNKSVMPALMQYLTLAPTPEETPLNLSTFLEIAAQAGLTLKYQRKSWEIYSRFGNGWQDRLIIPIIDRIWNDGVVWIGVFEKA